MKNKINWGIIGTGQIANKFVKALKLVDSSILYAVASRKQETADRFATEYDAIKSYGSYEEIINDSDVDIIYIATPHTMHKEHTMMCLKNKKAVLCEKPISINATDTKEMIDCARDNQTFLMEAMWTRFLPIMGYIKEVIDREEIGEIKGVSADFGFILPSEYPENGRLLSKELAGGALLDLGVYTVAFAQWIMKKPPTKIRTSIVKGITGVDLSVKAELSYDKEGVALLNCSLTDNLEGKAIIYGSTGSIHIPRFWSAEEVMVYKKNGENFQKRIPHKVNGYEYEIEAVNLYLKQGKLESDMISLHESYQIMQLIDKISQN